MKTIGLCAIVKDESAAILRCLRSAGPLIDYALIVDVGSTDGTQGSIRQYLSQHNLPGEVVEESRGDFAHNRTFALAKMREKENIDYALVVYADETVGFSNNFEAALAFKASLDKDLYNVEIWRGSARSLRPAILSNRLDFTYQGISDEPQTATQAMSAPGLATGFHIEAGTKSRAGALLAV